eukprot:2522804-Alexandrium_andersonii.AAC.1
MLKGCDSLPEAASCPSLAMNDFHLTSRPARFHMRAEHASGHVHIQPAWGHRKSDTLTNNMPART